MSLVHSLQVWWQRQTGEDDTPFDGDSASFLISLVVHLVAILTLSLMYTPEEKPAVFLTVESAPEDLEEVATLPQEFHFSDVSSDAIGANSLGDAGMALSLAPTLADVSEVPSPVELTPTDHAHVDINLAVQVPTGLQFANLPVKGVAGQGETGAAGAVDRLTQEILLSLEERKTLVIWIFDQSPSMQPQRKYITERIDRIYDELGVIEATGNPAFKRHDDKPLLTAVMAFGDRVSLLTPKPTDSLTEAKEAIAGIPPDDKPVERVFSAIYMAAEKFKNYRVQTGARNVMIVVFTDEAGDDQEVGLEQTVKACRRYQMPVYVVGAPAPFGQSETLVKWIDPDPNYDQTPQWGEVNQGPESFVPERLKLSFLTGEEKEPIDSGFGPFGLTRLCYETGGIYFAVHPNRNVNREVKRGEIAAYASHLKYFFDPVVMRKYRPDYVSADEYRRGVVQNKARAALVQAAQLSGIERLAPPRLEFIKRSEAEMAQDLSEAQKAAAKLEPVIGRMYEVLKVGESDRDKEVSPRWQAGYDLAMGQVLAIKLRTESYNTSLAAAKRGMKFRNEKNNTWILKASDEISGGSQQQKLAERTRMYLERVVKDHPNTPWALLAAKELEQPLSWSWDEKFTDLTPPPPANPGNNNNNNPAARDDARRNLAKPALPKREIKRL